MRSASFWPTPSASATHLWILRSLIPQLRQSADFPVCRRGGSAVDLYPLNHVLHDPHLEIRKGLFAGKRQAFNFDRAPGTSACAARRRRDGDESTEGTLRPP